MQAICSPSDIERNLARDPSIKTVVITSPTYEGVLSDTDEIFRITRKYDAVLITDCAHGAHLGLDDSFFGPDSKGDLVIKSLHKTLVFAYADRRDVISGFGKHP